MSEQQHGLTRTYNRLNDSDQQTDDIKNLRELHRQMDQRVAAEYGWDDIDLNHDFRPTKHGERFIVSEAARREVLHRLLTLNQERYAEEVKQGLHDKKKKGKAKAKTGLKKKAAPQRSLFPTDET
ncbi:MAG: hypothetical protein ACKVHE_30790 [Planctomycetales bacterium]